MACRCLHSPCNNLSRQIRLKQRYAAGLYPPWEHKFPHLRRRMSLRSGRSAWQDGDTSGIICNGAVYGTSESRQTPPVCGPCATFQVEAKSFRSYRRYSAIFGSGSGLFGCSSCVGFCDHRRLQLLPKGEKGCYRYPGSLLNGAHPSRKAAIGSEMPSQCIYWGE